MSKFTTREYKNIAKRPGQKGHGFPQRRKHEASEWITAAAEPVINVKRGPKATRFESGKAQQEAVRPDAEAAAVHAEEILTDLGEQEREMGLEEVELEFEGVNK